MKGIKFIENIRISAPQQAVFDFTQDYTNRLKWDTFLKKAELINGANEAGVGIKAWCVAKNNLGMETEYISFNRPKATAIKMTKGPYLFNSFLGSWTFNAIEARQTEVIFLYSFTLRFPFNLFTSLIKRNLQNNVRQRLTDLKTNMERK